MASKEKRRVIFWPDLEILAERTAAYFFVLSQVLFQAQLSDVFLLRLAKPWQACFEGFCFKRFLAKAAFGWESDDGIAEQGGDKVGDAVLAEHVSPLACELDRLRLFALLIVSSTSLALSWLELRNFFAK